MLGIKKTCVSLSAHPGFMMLSGVSWFTVMQLSHNYSVLAMCMWGFIILPYNQQFKYNVIAANLGDRCDIIIMKHAAAIFNQGFIVLPIISERPPLSPSIVASFCSSSLHLQPTSFPPVLPSFSCPSIRLPATPPSNHFSWVGLIKGDLTECADHRNINQSLSDAASPPADSPNLAANARSSAKVNCIHYIRDKSERGREGENTV